jgi:16S rRNA (cytidine1402-2'-O)-methyltransferase
MKKDQNLKTAALYVVALPIGNMADLSPHAQHVLSLVDIIAAEDTREFKNIVDAFSLSNKKVFAYHDHNEKESAKGLIGELLNQKSVALVSDAGTPNISDPGYHLLQECFAHNIPVIGIPGPSALTLALSICPIGGATHFFGGFAPQNKNGRIAFFKAKSKVAHRIVLFESPHRLLEHLEDAQKIFKGKTFVLREATKKFEEYLYLEIPDLIRHFKKQEPKGEFVIVYPGQEAEALSLEDLKKEIETFLKEKIKPTDILKKLQGLTSLGRREIYDLITEMKHKKDSHE